MSARQLLTGPRDACMIDMSPADGKHFLTDSQEFDEVATVPWALVSNSISHRHVVEVLSHLSSPSAFRRLDGLTARAPSSVIGGCYRPQRAVACSANALFTQRVYVWLSPQRGPMTVTTHRASIMKVPRDRRRPGGSALRLVGVEQHHWA